MKVLNTSDQPHSMKMVRNLHIACPNCGAPGEYRCEVWCRDGYSEAQIAEMIHLNPAMAEKADFYRAGWPKVWVNMTDPRFGQGVGPKCPQCGAKRAGKPKRLETINIFGRLF